MSIRPPHRPGPDHEPDPVPTLRPGQFVSAQLLLDLVTNPLDPGYAAAAARRRPGRTRRRDTPIVALGCLLIGFLLVVAWVHTHRSAPASAKVHQSLVDRVRTAEKVDASLDGQLQALENQVRTVRSGALSGNSGLARQLDGDQVAAGQTAVRGPGVRVTLTEPATATASAVSGRGGTVPIGASTILTDRDVRSVVNELWADGAQAIAVNGVRLTATSAIRFAGQAVLVDFQAITSPYVIEAIGNADALDTAFATSAVASRYQTLISADGIGFSLGESGSLTLPASAPFAPRYASTPSPTPSASRRETSAAPPTGAHR